MKVKNNPKYLERVRSKLVTMQENDFPDIDIDELGRMCFNLGKWKEFRDEDNFTARELITILINVIDTELQHT